MDTKQQNLPANIQVNTFTGGMNSDTSYDVTNYNQYIFGQNIRITNNTLIAGNVDPNNTENVVSPVPFGEITNVVVHNGSRTVLKFDTILACESVDDVGAVVIKDVERKWHVYRANIEDDSIILTRVFTSNVTTDKKRFSVVFQNEVTQEFTSDKSQKNVLKLYISDGEHPIMLLDINDEGYYNKISTINNLMSNRIFPSGKIKIVKKITGTLKTQLVQYCYRFYKRFGITSRLSPLTNKISVIGDSRDGKNGNESDSQTNVGFLLRIDDINRYISIFDHVQVFRISYLQKNSTPQINMIEDGVLNTSLDFLTFVDSGVKSLAQYTLDEFSSLYGTTLSQDSIHSYQGYLFSANVKDESIITLDYANYNPRAYQFNKDRKSIYYDDLDILHQVYVNNLSNVPESAHINKYVDINQSDTNIGYSINDGFKFDKDGYYGGTGPNISWRFVTCDVPIDTSVNYKAAPKSGANVSKNKLNYIMGNGSTASAGKTVSDHFSSCGVPNTSLDFGYHDIFTASLFRSLRRDEVYRYGIVFYTKYGQKTDVLWIADIRTPTIDEFPITYRKEGGALYARPLGIEFKVNNMPRRLDFLGYEIVRCEKTEVYNRNLLQVALSRPMRQYKHRQHVEAPHINQNAPTPYYPNVYLSTLFFYTLYGKGYNDDHYSYNHYCHPIPNSDKFDLMTDYFDGNGTNVENFCLYLAFSPEINMQSDDTLHKIQNSAYLLPLYYAGFVGSNSTLDELFISDKDDGGTGSVLSNTYKGGDWVSRLETGEEIDNWNGHNIVDGVYLSLKYRQNRFPDEKVDKSVVIKTYLDFHNPDIIGRTSDSGLRVFKNSCVNNSVLITAAKNVKNPRWYEFASGLEYASDGRISTGQKKYKDFMSFVGTHKYNNWVSNGIYDLALGVTDALSQKGNEWDHLRSYITAASDEKEIENADRRSSGAYGWIGPGPRCLLLQTSEPLKNNILCQHISGTEVNLGTICANIQHTAIQFAGTSSTQKQNDVYFGFGNYHFESEVNSLNTSSLTVFDGDIYIVPAEFVNMFKTYDFVDIETNQPSGQVVYYIPMETTINTFFDYGANYMNTSNPNLLLEPGDITGISQQDRPLHLYNTVYSDNNTSVQMYPAQRTDSNISNYKTRIHYSQLKTSGDQIDQWTIFKPADFIDVDSKYGEITNIDSTTNRLYFWQTFAFGALSVNERQLMTDQNNNVIQLGQGTILQRFDYISTNSGMRKNDFSSISIEDVVFWVDMMNKTVMMYSPGSRVLDYCEQTNVKNIANSKVDELVIPILSYDTQNQELLCKFLTENNLLVFNTKLNIATSIYTRMYNDTIMLDGVLYGIDIMSNNTHITRYNQLKTLNTYLVPIKLSFVVNSSASQTKVFDNLKVVMLKRVYDLNFVKKYLDNNLYTFTTDICETDNNIKLDGITDREGNICYSIPRYDNAEYGNRVRGKWMKVDIENDAPDKDYRISHIITKFRQSYS